MVGRNMLEYPVVARKPPVSNPTSATWPLYRIIPRVVEEVYGCKTVGAVGVLRGNSGVRYRKGASSDFVEVVPRRVSNRSPVSKE